MTRSAAAESNTATPTIGDVVRPTIAELFRYFVRLGATGFGGPIALVGQMEREFVDRRRWVTSQELKDGLAFSQLAPGPLAAQLAIYLGWLCGGVRGASVAGVAFIAPSFIMVIALAALYLRFGGLPWLQGAFYGVGAAAIAVIARSAAKLTRRVLGRDRLLWVLFAVAAVVTAWTESELAWLFVLCGVVRLLAKTKTPSSGVSVLVLGQVSGSWWSAGLHGVMPFGVVLGVFAYFASAGLFVFGSGLAIVPFLHGGVVLEHHWLTERQFLDAVAVALVTPGPVVITVAFIGYLVAGLPGATAAAAGVFAPVYLITLALARHYDRLKADLRVRAFVDGVTAAATGAIAGAAFVLGRRAIFDLTTATVAITAFIILTRFPKVPESALIVAAGIVGVVLRSSGVY